jgi:hypothetical protein
LSSSPLDFDAMYLSKETLVPAFFTLALGVLVEGRGVSLASSKISEVSKSRKLDPRFNLELRFDRDGDFSSVSSLSTDLDLCFDLELLLVVDDSL